MLPKKSRKKHKINCIFNASNSCIMCCILALYMYDKDKQNDKATANREYQKS